MRTLRKRTIRVYWLYLASCGEFTICVGDVKRIHLFAFSDHKICCTFNEINAGWIVATHSAIVRQLRPSVHFGVWSEEDKKLHRKLFENDGIMVRKNVQYLHYCIASQHQIKFTSSLLTYNGNSLNCILKNFHISISYWI